MNNLVQNSKVKSSDISESFTLECKRVDISIGVMKGINLAKEVHPDSAKEHIDVLIAIKRRLKSRTYDSALSYFQYYRTL